MSNELSLEQEYLAELKKLLAQEQSRNTVPKAVHIVNVNLPNIESKSEIKRSSVNYKFICRPICGLPRVILTKYGSLNEVAARRLENLEKDQEDCETGEKINSESKGTKNSRGQRKDKLTLFQDARMPPVQYLDRKKRSDSAISKWAPTHSHNKLYKYINEIPFRSLAYENFIIPEDMEQSHKESSDEKPASVNDKTAPTKDIEPSAEGTVQQTSETTSMMSTEEFPPLDNKNCGTLKSDRLILYDDVKYSEMIKGVCHLCPPANRESKYEGEIASKHAFSRDINFFSHMSFERNIERMLKINEKIQAVRYIYEWIKNTESQTEKECPIQSEIQVRPRSPGIDLTNEYPYKIDLTDAGSRYNMQDETFLRNIPSTLSPLRQWLSQNTERWGVSANECLVYLPRADNLPFVPPPRAAHCDLRFKRIIQNPRRII